MEAAVFFVTMALAVVGYFYAERKAKLKFARRFRGREELGVEQVCQLFCTNGFTDTHLARELIEYVAGELEMSPGLLRPTDRFEVEMKPLRGWVFDSARTTLLLDLAHVARQQGKQLDISGIKTLDDYIRAMAAVY
jgi:hypothetical protein